MCAKNSTLKYVNKGIDVKINDEYFKLGIKAVKQYAIQNTARFYIDSREDVLIDLNLSSAKDFRKIDTERFYIALNKI
ncbi:MAG: hypothetical protein U5L45_00240 [Saprospiraceae bacterium]|nr:hypothetical protein [Saprospiraceae bacterium]